MKEEEKSDINLFSCLSRGRESWKDKLLFIYVITTICFSSFFNNFLKGYICH